MMCYKDKTFCTRSKECKNRKCGRNIRYEKIPSELMWMPIAFSEFSDCTDFKKRKESDTDG